MSTEFDHNATASAQTLQRMLLQRLASPSPQARSPVAAKLAALGVAAADDTAQAGKRLERLERLWKDAHQVGTDQDQGVNPHARSKVAVFWEDAVRNRFEQSEIKLFMDLVVARQQGR